MRVYNKLVRDNIPKIILENGEKPHLKVLDEKDFKRALEEKLYEEYKEVLDSSYENRIEELADMIEVIRHLALLEDKTLDDVINCANEKRKVRGGFDKRVFLESVED